MKVLKNILYIVFPGLIIGGCQKDVILEIPAAINNPLFIEGMLYPGENPRIYISRSQPFFSSEVLPSEVFVRDCDVRVIENSNVYNLFADSVFNKFRCRWELFYSGNFLPEAGNTYSLEVNHDGKTYSASTTINQRPVEIESIEYIAEFFDVYGGHDGVVINITDHPGNGDYYRFQMNRMIDNSVLHAHALDEIVNNCTEADELFHVIDIGRVVYSDENVDGQKIEMMIEVSYEYSEGDVGYIFMQSLDKNAAEFYINLDDQLQAILNPFVEPVFIKTKIEGAIGVFGSAVLSDSIKFVYPQDNP